MPIISRIFLMQTDKTFKRHELFSRSTIFSIFNYSLANMNHNNFLKLNENNSCFHFISRIGSLNQNTLEQSKFILNSQLIVHLIENLSRQILI